MCVGVCVSVFTRFTDYCCCCWSNIHHLLKSFSSKKLIFLINFFYKENIKNLYSYCYRFHIIIIIVFFLMLLLFNFGKNTNFKKTKKKISLNWIALVFVFNFCICSQFLPNLFLSSLSLFVCLRKLMMSMINFEIRKILGRRLFGGFSNHHYHQKKWSIIFIIDDKIDFFLNKILLLRISL